jgi:hypothetical protein
MAATLEQ